MYDKGNMFTEHVWMTALESEQRGDRLKLVMLKCLAGEL